MSSSDNLDGFFDLGKAIVTHVKVPSNVVTRLPRTLLHSGRFSLRSIKRLPFVNLLPSSVSPLTGAEKLLGGADKALGAVGLPEAQRTQAGDNVFGFTKQLVAGKVDERDLDVGSAENQEKLRNLRRYGLVGGTVVNKRNKYKRRAEEKKAKEAEPQPVKRKARGVAAGKKKRFKTMPVDLPTPVEAVAQ